LQAAGLSPRLATACRSIGTMDYLVAGVAALFLFGYLIYALLKPEQF
jgi:K+-transporting ATPase KdpF subunit